MARIFRSPVKHMPINFLLCNGKFQFKIKDCYGKLVNETLHFDKKNYSDFPWYKPYFQTKSLRYKVW